MNQFQKLPLESSINRFGENRGNDAEITDLFFQLDSKIIFVYKGRFVCHLSQLNFYTLSELDSLPLPAELIHSILNDKKNRQLPQDSLYLGEYTFDEQQSSHLFVIPISPRHDLKEDMELLDARSLSFSSGAELLELVFYIQGLISWHFTHSFCAKCGSKTMPSQSGHSRTCLSSSCSKQHFPRIEPAVIFSICRKASKAEEEDKILLARQSSWPEKRYSVIAGFAEHGENLEQAVAREAYEEVGLKVNNIHYFGSQPWPFPASLMIGFSSETNDDEIRLIDKELENAQWFTARDIKSQIETGHLLTPFSISISWKIIESWYQQQTGQSLKSIVKKDE